MVNNAETNWTLASRPGTGHYFCPVCGVRFSVSVQLSDHISSCHCIGFEPNYLNEYSVGEIVSGINNLAVGRKFRFDVSTEKPKFQMEPKLKILSMGAPSFDTQEAPSSMETILDTQVVNVYQNVPTGLIGQPKTFMLV
eukprot:5983323-Amphidinium_carterae.6